MSAVPAGRAVVGVGVDCEDLERWRTLLPRIRDGRFGRTFSEAEVRACEAGGDAAAHYAGRWCAKEAVVKALAGRVRLTPREVEIEVNESGAPVARIRRPRAAEEGIDVKLSIAHSQTQAVAFAVAVEVGTGRTP